jgi:predicted ribosomally synthesized peptide with SipW-like signal peptide
VKKIIGLSIAALLILALVGGATWALFSDTETSANNTLVAGTLDLNINGGNTAVSTFSAANVKPGDNNDANQAAASSILLNKGSLAGKLTMSAAVVGLAGPAPVPADPDIVPTNSLKDVATVALYIDKDGDGHWSSGDIGLKSDGTTYAYAVGTPLSQAAMSAYDGKNWASVLPNMATTESDKFAVNWEVPTAATNAIQGGSATMTFTFVLNQLP